MRTVDVLLGIEEIAILYQYLYLDESNYITVDNGMCKMEIRMSETGRFYAKNLNFPELPALDYTENMTLPQMLGIISQLKEVPPVIFDRFSSRWEELLTITLGDVCQNRMKWDDYTKRGKLRDGFSGGN